MHMHSQAYIELASLEEMLEPYLSEQSLTNFESSREYLAEWDVHADDKLVNVHNSCIVLGVCVLQFWACIPWIFTHTHTHTIPHSVHKVVDQFKEKTKLQLRCFRMPEINNTLEEDDEIKPEEKPARRFVPLPD